MHNYYDFIGQNVKQVRLETGRTMVSIERMLEIAQILGVRPGDILNEPIE